MRLTLLALALSCATACVTRDYCAGVVCGEGGTCEPATGECVCDVSACSGGFACDYSGEQCVDRCLVDTECQLGFVCDSNSGACEPVCDDDDCGAYVCDEFANECLEECWTDGDCADGYHCCDVGSGEDGCDYKECTR